MIGNKAQIIFSEKSGKKRFLDLRVYYLILFFEEEKDRERLIFSFSNKRVSGSSRGYAQ